MSYPNKKMRLVIVGGGTAGWMTAAAFAKMLGKVVDITLLESDTIGSVGVGEATIPTLQGFHNLLGLSEQEVMAATNATFKLGIQFENWRQRGEDYLHSFGYFRQDNWAASLQHYWRKGIELGIDFPIGDYCREHLAAREHKFGLSPSKDPNHAYHLDATLYAQYLRVFAEPLGVKRREGKCTSVEINETSGFIESLNLESGEQLDGDFFIDCTGFSALLIEKTLHTGYEDWSHWLPCDKAIAVQTESNGEFLPYTRSIARENGWQWRIPLQNRTGNGLVFCSRYMSDDQAIELLTANVEGKLITPPRVITYRTGTRRKHWNKNCVAIGLSSGFIEPLESTSIHLIQRSIVRLLQLFPTQGTEAINADEYNQQMRLEIENIRDFIILHYHLTDRTDSPFWRYCRSMSIPESLRHRIKLFGETGRAYKYANDVFGETSWVQVMLGQGMLPKTYHPQVDALSNGELTGYLSQIRANIRQEVDELPAHIDFVNKYCPSLTLSEKQQRAISAADTQIVLPDEDTSTPVMTVRRVGLLQTPVIIVDNFVADGGKKIRESAAQAEFIYDADSYYPGVRAALPSSYTFAVTSVIRDHIIEVYGIAADLQLSVKKSCFSLITKPEIALTAEQRLPHFDTSNPYYFAVLHYLGEGVHGDTAFFRHRPSGFERIFPADEAHYFANVNRSLAETAGEPARYIGSDDAHFTLYDRIEYKPNRLVIYPGNLLHSTLVKTEADISGNWQTGRLTANIFIEFEKQP